MEFQHSNVVDQATYRTEGLCDGIPLRLHNDSVKEIMGAIRAQRDWAKFVGPLGHYNGGLGERYSFVSVTVPECCPERLKIISYANEFAFLYDDEMEKIDDQGLEENRKILEVFGEGALSHDTECKATGEKMMQSQILSEMMAIDYERALVSMRSWATFVQLAAARTRTQPFKTLEEYLPYRIMDAGEMIWFGTVTFGMALTIPDGEMDLCKQLAWPGFAAISLTNDLYSWEKERDAAKRDGAPHVVNAIWVLMREVSTTELEAKSLCRTKIKEYVAQYVRIVERTKNNMDLSRDLRAYIEAIQYSLSGNLVWSIYCPRYQQEAPCQSIVSPNL